MLLAQKASQAFHRRAADLRLIKVAPDNRLQALAGAAVRQSVQTVEHRVAQLAGYVAHGRLQQTIFVFEIVTDDPRRYARPPGNLRDGRVVHTDFIYCVQRGVDQLPAPDRLHPQFGHFCHSIHQRWLTIKAVFDWTFNIKCVLIVADLDFNSYKNSGDTG